MTVIRQLSLGVRDDERAGAFWAATLGYVRRPPRYDGDDWIVLEPPPGVAGCPIAMDVSESPAEDLPRVHLDLAVEGTGLDAEVERLVGLGARVVETRTRTTGPYVETWTVMKDPEDNGFCVQ